MSDMTEATKPSNVLKAEHQVILRVIEVLKHHVGQHERSEQFDVVALNQCVEFFRFFADACHHAKEEDLLFPVMEQSGIPRDGGPIGCMLEEHRLARGFTADMGEALESFSGGDATAKSRFDEAARQYIDLLTNHINKEDNVLFNMGDHIISQDDQAKLCSQFCEVGCQKFGGKTRSQLEQLAEELEQSRSK